MFGSISNWVSENKPAMPSMPAMPTVNMPNVTMPNVSMPGFLNKNKENADENPEGPEGEQKPTEQTEATTETVKVENIEEKSESAAAEVAESEVAADQTSAPTTPEDEAAKGTGYNLGAAREMGSNIGSMLFSFGSKATSNVRNATTSLKDVIQKKTIIGEFNKENEKFINEKKSQERNEDAAVPPWVGYNEEEKLKEQILALSTDSRNFLRAPPSGVEFNFNFNSSYPIAMAILEEDPALSEMRFKLVPKQVKEENFWLNYFYRVSLIKQSTTLDEINKQNVETASSESKTSQATKQDTLEFVSDTYDENLNDEELKKELQQLNLDTKKIEDDLEDAEWDIKPEDVENISAEEIEKEINSMLN